MIRRVRRPAVILSSIIALISQSVMAQDWPGWRGPSRDGAISLSEKKSWPETLKLKWKTDVGEGHSSPIVVGDRVFLHTRRSENEVVACFDLDTGKSVWSDSYPVAYTMNPTAVAHGKGPKSTPMARSGKLYTLGIAGVLTCYDAKTGKVQWRKEFSGAFKSTSPLYGTAMSPIVDNNLLITHVGGHDNGALMAFNADTGEVKWSWKGDGPGYASPIVVELGGARQIITQTQKFIVGISAASGELLWSIPFTTEYDQNIVTPVVYKQTLIFSGYDKGTMAVRVVKRADKWATEQAWHNTQVSMYLNSPILSGDLLFGLSHKRKGQFFCLDARTGETLWTSNGREGENAAMLSGGGVLLFLTNDAELVVAKASAKGFEPIKRYAVAKSPTWAHPVVLGNRILIKDASTLSLWGIE